MMNGKIRNMRIPVELEQLKAHTASHGITCVPAPGKCHDFSMLLAVIPGPVGSPFEKGKFEVQINIVDQYPFRPPSFKFLTPVFHPNIDISGAICLNLLRMPPNGTYNPTITLESILLSIQLLLATPNPDDPLRGEAADLFKSNYEMYCKVVQEEVRKQNPEVSHACSNTDDDGMCLECGERVKKRAKLH